VKNDPHEAQGRQAGFQKTTRDEDWLAAFNSQLERLDLPAPEQAQAAVLPIVYIAGTPRSGTTLLSQILSHCLDVGYINNLIAKFWMRPSVGIRLSRAVLGDDPGRFLDFESNYGTTQGAAGPHEFGYFWRHWLRLDTARTHHLTTEELRRVDKAGFKKALEHDMLANFGKALVTKNVICGFHAECLTGLHPNSLFITINRDPYETARSILHARQTRYGDYAVWWSLKPKAWPLHAADPAEEVALQVLHCRKELEAETNRPGVRSLHVSYEELCENPQATLRQVCNAVQGMNYALRIIRDLKNSFIARKENTLPQEMEKSLRKVLSAFANE
jgi:LPS sulfotransferase NodH